MPYSKELGGLFTELMPVYLSEEKRNKFYSNLKYSSWNLAVRL